MSTADESASSPLPRFSDRTLQALYAQSLRSQWSVEQVIDWPTVDLAAIHPLRRGHLARIYQDTLHAEKLGLELARRAVVSAPEAGLRHLATMQLRDESRHVAFFSRLCTSLEYHVDPSPELVELKSSLQDVYDYDELLLHGHILEVAARALFLTNAGRSMDALKRSVRLPGTNAMLSVLHVLTAHISEDESRHIAFGHRCLRLRLKQVSSPAVRELERRARATALFMYETFAAHSQSFQAFGLDPRTTLAGVWGAMRRTLDRLDLNIGHPPLSRANPS
ncbi:MAG: hypothetical protein OXR73_28405 [Myxococcales bacterium]|nr:hypothetical protein [Myxococcales bacterium]